MKPITLKFVNGHAFTPFGDYVIWTVRNNPPLVHLQFREFFWLHKSEAEAIAAAQRDFEERLRGCYE